MDDSTEAQRDPAAASRDSSVDEVRGPALRRALALVTLAWVFGAVWMTSIAGTPQTNFANSLGASKFQFGLLSALPFIASLFSMPASLLTEATGKRKRIFLWGHYFQRLMWFPIALLPIWLVSRYGTSAFGPAMVMFLWLMFMMYIGQAVGGPAWVSWMADICPERARGKYFSRRRQWGILSALPAALIVGWLLDRHGTGDSTRMMWVCALIFMGAAVFGVVDIALFHFVPNIPREPRRGARLFAAWREPLKNPRFLWFAGFVATLVFAVSFMGQFVTLHVMDQLRAAGRKINLETQAMLLVAPSAAQLLLFGLWGKAVDRLGKRPVLILAALGLVPVGLAWCLVMPSTLWLGYVLAGAGAALWAGVEVANLNMVLEMSGTNEEGGTSGSTSYVAVNSVIINVAGALGGLSAGVIAEVLEDWTWVVGVKTFGAYDVLFVLSAMLRFLSVVVFLPHVREPGSGRTREVLRFMTANIYNNVFNAVFQPLRLLAARRDDSYPARRDDDQD